jgi:cytochrome P450
VFGQEAWLVTGHADVREVLSDPDRFTVEDSAPILRTDDPHRWEQPGCLLFTDPPRQTAIRDALTAFLSPGSVRRLAPSVESLVEEKLDVLAGLGWRGDLVAGFAATSYRG